jgi:hypothetical protein
MAMEHQHEAPTNDQNDNASHGDAQTYLRFGAMILTGMATMYALMFVSIWEWDHLRWSENRFFMTLTMGGAMGIIMWGWMLNMYRNTRLNMVVITLSLLLLIGGVYLDRSQATIEDTSFMSSMIPHHSMAILRSERSNLVDARVCELAIEISEAQRREILEMEWLINDIEKNGPATTAAEADNRPVPTFDVSAERRCPTN